MGYLDIFWTSLLAKNQVKEAIAQIVIQSRKRDQNALLLAVLVNELSDPQIMHHPNENRKWTTVSNESP